MDKQRCPGTHMGHRKRKENITELHENFYSSLPYPVTQRMKNENGLNAPKNSLAWCVTFQRSFNNVFRRTCAWRTNTVDMRVTKLNRIKQSAHVRRVVVKS